MFPPKTTTNIQTDKAPDKTRRAIAQYNKCPGVTWGKFKRETGREITNSIKNVNLKYFLYLDYWKFIHFRPAHSCSALAVLAEIRFTAEKWKEWAIKRNGKQPKKDIYAGPKVLISSSPVLVLNALTWATKPLAPPTCKMVASAGSQPADSIAYILFPTSTISWENNQSERI